MSASLDTLASLKPGDTLTQTKSGKYKVIRHDSWWSSIVRRNKSESRHNTVDYIDAILAENLFTKEALESKESLEGNLMNKVAVGIGNLAITYKDDSIICQQIRSRQQRIYEYLSIRTDFDIPPRRPRPIPVLRPPLIVVPFVGSDDNSFMDGSSNVKWTFEQTPFEGYGSVE